MEMMHDIAVEANVRNRPILLDILEKLNVKIETGMKGIRIDNQGSCLY